ncbi:MAG: ABC transporter permease [Flavobacteriaceae bacterium]|nr:ABC transporter permease [Flavobacteriaceae bacterium]
MKNIILIAKREFFTQVKKKSFIILTLLTPLLIIVFGGVVSLMFQANETQMQISVIDKSGLFKDKLKSDQNIRYVFSSEETEKSLIKTLETTEEMNGVMIIPKKEIHELENSIEILTNKNLSNEARRSIAGNISEIIKAEKINALGISTAQIEDLNKGVNLHVVNVLEKEKKQDSFLVGVKSGLSMFLMYCVFTFIMMYGIRVMRSVLEEKNNRVVEILISSVKPFELMMGKILGVTGVALVQFGVWVVMIFASVMTLGSSNVGMVSGVAEVQMVLSALSQINYGLILFVFVIYFLLGYLFYSAMYAAIGSAVDNETETQQFTLFAILPMMLGFYGSITIMNNPDGPMSFWLSMIPFTSPIAMLARIPFDVPVWELVLSIVILLVSTLGTVFIASKIYRVGILMYGNKVTLKELWKWMKN